MKRSLIACLFLVIAMWHALPGFAAEAAASSTTGIRQGKAEELLAIARGGTQNADLCYNIGVAYFEEGKPGKATLYYLKALAIDSAHRQARDNLNYLQGLLFGSSTSARRPFLEKVFYSVYDFLSLDRMALLCLLLLLLTVLDLHWLIRYPQDRERGLPLLTLMICVILLLGSVLVVGVKQHRTRTNTTAVVTSPDAPLYDDADGTQGPGRVAVEGTILHVLDSKGAFTKVRSDEGATFWLRSSHLEKVSE